VAHEPSKELESWRVRCSSKGLGVAQAAQLDVAAEAPRSVVAVEASLGFTACMPPFGTSGRRLRSEDAATAAAAIAAGHFEQACRVRGSVSVGDTRFDVDGLGLRDRSWGPRDWSVPWGWRWFSMPFSEDFAIGVHSVMFPGREVQAGWAWRDGRTIKMSGFTLDTTYESGVHRSMRIEAKDVEDRTYRIAGEVGPVIPLTIGSTRVKEGLTRFTLDDGREATGLAEYLDNT
jgi:predicted secreted hydrolase